MAQTLNDFISIVGGDPHTLQNYFVVTRGIQKGADYTFRYRAINAVGPGPWSDSVTIKAATFPSPPGKPYYISSTSTTITLGLPPSIDNGGSKIRLYKLFRDDGNLSSDINLEVLDYNGKDQEYTVTNLAIGFVYRFAY
jgi:hypothetical protein